MGVPRHGDTVLDAGRMAPFYVEETKGPHVYTRKPSGGQGRTFRLENLECVDHDEGLWQEVERLSMTHDRCRLAELREAYAAGLKRGRGRSNIEALDGEAFNQWLRAATDRWDG